MLKCVNRTCKWCKEELANGCGLFGKATIKECKRCIFREVKEEKKEASNGNNK